MNLIKHKMNSLIDTTNLESRGEVAPATIKRQLKPDLPDRESSISQIARVRQAVDLVTGLRAASSRIEGCDSMNSSVGRWLR